VSAKTGAAGLVAAIIAALVLAHGHTTTSATSGSGPAPSASAGGPGPAVGRLAALTVRTEDTGAHYDRDTWGDWTTRGGCDTREQILRRDGTAVTTGRGCRIIAGTWTSPYDEVVLRNPSGVQIDHRVPVREALRSGARNWTAQQRARFYNNPANLVAVSGRSNTSKGARDPARWRPPARASWCSYAAAYVAAKSAYRLTVDPAERDGLAAMLRTCPGGAR
jgi:hypothetical protein